MTEPFTSQERIQRAQLINIAKDQLLAGSGSQTPKEFAENVLLNAQIIKAVLKPWMDGQ